MNTEARSCPVCGAAVRGRSDKRFCCAKCKSIHQYESRQKKEAFYIQVDRQLKVNRKILRAFNKKGHSTIRKADLHKEGFDPNYFTHYWKNKKGMFTFLFTNMVFWILRKTGSPNTYWLSGRNICKNEIFFKFHQWVQLGCPRKAERRQ